MRRTQRRMAFWITLIGAVVLSAIVVPLWVTADSGRPAFTATLYSDVIRFEADGVASLRVTIYDLSENELWSSGLIMGDFVDWDRMNARGERLANGYYLYLAQGWDSSDALILNKVGKVVLLPGNQVELKAAPVVGAVVGRGDDPVISTMAQTITDDLLVRGEIGLDVVGDNRLRFLDGGSTQGQLYYFAALNYLGFHAMSGNSFRCYTQDAGGTLQERMRIEAGDNPKIYLGRTCSASDRTMTLDTGNQRVGIGTTSPSEQLVITGNFRLPPTTSTTGIIYAGSIPFIHNYGAVNTFVGEYAGNFTMTGRCSTAVGREALYSNTTGYGNTAVGSHVLRDNTMGSRNTAVGYYALCDNTTGGHNTAAGLFALNFNTTGGWNTAVGGYALIFNGTGNFNTAVGNYALQWNSSGVGNTALGCSADVSSYDLTNATAIGYGAVVDASNKVRIGNDSVTVIEGKVDWTYTSDRNRKENFLQVDGGAVLEKLSDIPVSSWNYIGQDPAQFRHYGCVSQDFFAVFGRDGLGTIGTETTLTGSDVDGILMASTQALYDLLQAKDAEIEAQQDQIDELRAEVEALKQAVDSLRDPIGLSDPIASEPRWGPSQRGFLG